MSRIRSLAQQVPTTWQYALLGGLLSLPFTVASYAQTHAELSLSAVLGGGFIAGYLATRRTGDSAGVGVRAGVVGALPVLWMLVDMAGAVGGLPNPPWFALVLIGAALTVTVLGFGLGALGGAVGAGVGGWAARVVA